MTDDLTRLPIILVNRSRSGLTIELQEQVALPRTFRILFDRSIEPCTLVWQEGRLAGVQVNGDNSIEV